MKKTFCFLFLTIAALLFSVPVYAGQNRTASSADPDGEANKYYQELLRQSGADSLSDSLPEDTRKILGQLGVGGTDWNSILSVTPQNYFQKILSIFTGKLKNPLKVCAAVTAVILLCALLSGMKLSFGEQPMGGVINMVGTLCVCTLVIAPIVTCISDSADVLKASADFLLACIPVLAGVMVAAGQSVSAGSYHLLMMAAGNAISLFASNFLIPMMNIFLALSIVSAISPNINLNGLCAALNKAIKWVMGLGMTLFTSLITIHSLVAASLDTTGSKAIKFVVSSCVPVVGNALGEALNTVTGCVKMLKSGICAFGLLAGIFVFLPVLAECFLWMLTLILCSGISQIFEMKEITTLLKASSDAVSTVMAILLCCMTVLIVSTVVMLVIGGAS